MYKRGLAAALVLTTCLFWSSAAEEQHKRAPSGFTGVRGKKSVLPPDFGQEDDDEPVSGLQEKRAPSGFMGMRGKKLFTGWEGTQPDGLFKRAPSGFMGMRGKKDVEVTNYDEYAKRAPSGFVGMRGKKDPFEEAMDKRAPMGFVGMRGKKDPDNQWEEKRAPSGFFGMRGKKMPRQSGFFGMRGKKYPYEFRGKFVGVRGKKADEEFRNDLDLTSMGQNLDLNQLMLLLTENDNVWEGNEVEQSN